MTRASAPSGSAGCPLAGWEGTFALHTAASAAGGTWLCFTDADTVHDPAAIDQALGFTQARGLATLSMTSRQLTESSWEKIVQPVVFGLLDQWYPLARVNDPPRPRRPPTASSSWDARGL